METTAQNLQGFIDEVLEVLRGLPGENYVPDNPDLNPGTWPYLTVYSTNSTTTNLAGGRVQTDLNDITIAMVIPLDDLATAVSFLLPYREQIPRAIYDQFVKGTFGNRSSHIQHIGSEIQLTLGPIEWIGGAVMFGWLITLVGVKIQNEV